MRARLGLPAIRRDSLLNQSATAPASVAGWRDAVARSLLNFDFDFVRPERFRGQIGTKAFAGLSFISMNSGGHAAYRDESKIGDDERPDYLLTLQLSGEITLSQDGRSTVLKPGDFAFYNTTRPATLVSSDDYRSMSVKFPQRLLSDPRGQLRDLTATGFKSEDGIAPAVWALLEQLNQTSDSVHRSSQEIAVTGVMNLIGTMLGSQVGLRGLVGQQDPRRELLERVYAFIDEHLADPGLGPQEVAAAHFISTRHLHGLFQDSGMTVAAWIRERRLEHCRRDLSDPLMAATPVAAIAGRWGFKGASHFGQVFKTATGQTPADFRRLSLGPDGLD
jgi:AraC-like DNA-binding protein